MGGGFGDGEGEEVIADVESSSGESVVEDEDRGGSTLDPECGGYWRGARLRYRSEKGWIFIRKECVIVFGGRGGM